MIQSLYNRLQRGDGDKKGLSSKTIHNVHGVLSKALNQAVWNEMIRSNPATLTILPRKTRKDIQILTDAQIQMFSALKNDKERLLTPPPILLSILKEQKVLQMQQRMQAGPA